METTSSCSNSEQESLDSCDDARSSEFEEMCQKDKGEEFQSSKDDDSLKDDRGNDSSVDDHENDRFMDTQENVHEVDSSNDDPENTDGLENRIKRLQSILSSLKKEIEIVREINQEEAQELEKKILEMEEQKNQEVELTENQYQYEVSSESDLYQTGACSDISENTVEFGLLSAQPGFMDLVTPPLEGRLMTYCEDVTKSQLENRLRVRRQFAVNTYREQLLEVEKLCYEEMLRVKQNVCELEPLTKMASEWTVGPNPNDKYSYIKHDIFIRRLQCIGSSLRMNNSDIFMKNLETASLQSESLGQYQLTHNINTNIWTEADDNKLKSPSCESLS